MEHTRRKLLRLLSEMRKRCYDENNKNYDRYGGRGILICKEWNDNHEAFVEWALSNGYDEGLTIDRIDVNGNYCPENCRWITNEENARWKSTTNVITVDGVTKTGKQWATDLGFGVNYINKYIRKHSIEEVVDYIRQVQNREIDPQVIRAGCKKFIIIINGIKGTYSYWSVFFGHSKDYLYNYKYRYNGDLEAVANKCRELYLNKFHETPEVQIIKCV